MKLTNDQRLLQQALALLQESQRNPPSIDWALRRDEIVTKIVAETAPIRTEQQALTLASHRHYKGGLYRVLNEATHSETLEQTTIYEHLWPHERKWWARPTELFNNNLPDGSPRFTPLVKK